MSLQEFVEAYFSLPGGLGLTALAMPLVERTVHRWWLHAKKNEIIEVKLGPIELSPNKASTKGHTEHHLTHRGPAHYYHDITNEHNVIHFAKGDVVTLEAVFSGLAAATETAYSVIANQPAFTPRTALFAAGAAVATFGGWFTYEVFHHYMHVIGKRRLAINRELGNIVQGRQSDDNLRFSKILLDDIGTVVEDHVDKYVGKSAPDISLDDSLVKRFAGQIAYNKYESDLSPVVAVDEKSARGILVELAYKMLKREQRIRSSLSGTSKVRYWLDRKMQSQMRHSYIFKKLDNHHFMHHYEWYKNLNVVFPFMDKIMGTKVDSSVEALENNKKYWLCPNSSTYVPSESDKDKIREKMEQAA